MSTTLSSADVARVSGASFREIDYWCRKGYVPGQEALLGSGNPRVWTPQQVEWVANLVHLTTEGGLSVQGAVTALESAYQDADGYWRADPGTGIRITWRRAAASPAEAVPA